MESGILQYKFNMLRQISALALICFTILNAACQPPFQQKLIISTEGYPLSFPIAAYKFKLHADIKENGGAYRGGGGNISIYHNPVKFFIYGGSVGFFSNPTDLTNLLHSTNIFIANTNGLVRSCGCDTSYYIKSKSRTTIPILAKVGLNIPIKRFNISLTSGVGTLISITPAIELNQRVRVNWDLYRFIKTVMVFKQQSYWLFAYNLSASVEYRIIPALSVGLNVYFTGTQNKDQPYVLQPVYGYRKYVMYISTGLSLKLNIPVSPLLPFPKQ